MSPERPRQFTDDDVIDGIARIRSSLEAPHLEALDKAFEEIEARNLLGPVEGHGVLALKLIAAAYVALKTRH